MIFYTVHMTIDENTVDCLPIPFCGNHPGAIRGEHQLSISPADGTITGAIKYAKRVFPEATIVRVQSER